MNNIFDLDDMSDLPEEIRPKNSQRGRWEDLLRDAGGPISVAQFRAAAFRRHQKVFDANNAAATLRMLCQRGKAARVDTGVYVHVDNAFTRPGFRAAG